MFLQKEIFPTTSGKLLQLMSGRENYNLQNYPRVRDFSDSCRRRHRRQHRRRRLRRNSIAQHFNWWLWCCRGKT